MKELILAKLNDSQIANAKQVNGAKKQITHVLVCGDYGQIFGTEKHCYKYYNAWKKIFKDLFSNSKSVNAIEIASYTSTFDLVNILLAAQDELPNSSKNRLKQMLEDAGISEEEPKIEKKSLFKKLFG